jgi:hypothetical protein
MPSIPADRLGVGVPFIAIPIPSAIFEVGRTTKLKSAAGTDSVFTEPVMRLFWASPAALLLLGCSALGPAGTASATPSCQSAPTDEASSQCVRVYFFESKVIGADGQLERTGGGVLPARSCVDELVGAAVPGGSDRYRVEADPRSPRSATFDAVVSGEHIRARIPIHDGIRVVLGEVVRPDRSATVLLTVTAFSSVDQLRRDLKSRFAQTWLAAGLHE